jgi:hypothetical protein
MTRARQVDLHTHTNVSDGQFTPAELVALAIERGLDLIAITDHDTTGAISPALEAANGALDIIPAVELSAENAGLDVHTLGYFVDIDNPRFQEQLARFRDDRYRRGEQIVQRLRSLGYPLDWERVQEIAGGGALGRPHIARALLEAGHVTSIHEAFDRFIHNQGPAYVARRRLTPEEAIDLIHSAGGVAVMAHPGLVPGYPAIIKRLVLAGLDGVEVAHPKNGTVARQNLRGLAKVYDLVMTGGSDFHGADAEGSLALGSVSPPAGCVASLIDRARRYKSEYNP